MERNDDELVLAARIERIAEWNPHLRHAERADLHHAAQLVTEAHNTGRQDAVPADVIRVDDQR